MPSVSGAARRVCRNSSETSLPNRLGKDRLTLLAEICDALDLVPVLVPQQRLMEVQALLGIAASAQSGSTPPKSHEPVLREMGRGDHDQFDVLTRLGVDLPGAVLVAPETKTPASAGPFALERVAGIETPRPRGIVKCSLAGVQLKFAGRLQDGRLNVPARAGEARCIRPPIAFQSCPKRNSPECNLHARSARPRPTAASSRPISELSRRTTYLNTRWVR